MFGPHNTSLGQFKVPSRQVFDQLRARVTPAFGYVYVSVSRDVRSVAASPSSSFNPATLLFPFSDSGFASLPSSMPSYSSPAFSLPLSSSSALTFSSLTPSDSSTPLPLFSLPSVVPSVLPLSSSSSAPSFPLQQFPPHVYSSAAPLPSFSAPPLPSAPVGPTPGFFCSALPSSGSALFRSFCFYSVGLLCVLRFFAFIFRGPSGIPPSLFFVFLFLFFFGFWGSCRLSG